ncbi:MAG TPA: Gfo/Idh/MocA family oxidoreductase, partial [Daejeonella sp.]|nr:Gfo/Idh/MocA family oxidoreductase [Daejeonella sp.]
MSNHINWGIIGCGDVTEVKSGPAFNKVDRSSLHAVMRRNAAKAKDYAERHNVPVWYDSADDLIADNLVNAVYIATPPAYHEEYAVKALKAGKDVYVEKPMALTASGCQRIAHAAELSGGKVSVAHYRRAMPFFLKIKELIESNTIGQVLFVNLKMFQGAKNEVISKTEDNWRLDPLISGGGLFYDLAPHQIDMMLYLFGSAQKASGFSSTTGKTTVPDLISGQILLPNNVLFNGLWCFNVPE